MTDIPKENNAPILIQNTAPTQHTGWASLAKTIRELDEAKMKDCKDDIDTLLIFAGLFSTVMTAFLVESYRNLLIDNNDTMVDLLQQTSAQTRGYATTTGFINATDAVTISDPTLPFEPSRDAIRVNVLWFASLIFSLSAASFGMLVKQWLREYMAGDYTSPRVRIRIRQYRHPSLARWKVFEIAAILPLMLQLALGLFFAGLCVFTWSANHHVAYTSMPLVGGWALLFLFATIAPAFSPRCPYKTAFTRRGMKSLRKLLFHSAFSHALDSCCSRLSWRAIKPVIHPRSPNQKEEPSSADRKVEEEDVIQDDGDDISLLATLDGMLRDDDLLPTSIAQALQQMQTDPSDVIKFIFGAVERRIHEDFPLTNTSLPNLQRKLTKYVWNNLVNFTAEVMRTYLNQPRRELQRDSQLPDWMSYALTFLFSLCEHALTKEGEHVIFMCLSFQTDPAIHNGAIRLIASHASGGKVQYGHILGQLRGVFEEIAEADERRRLLLLIERDRLGKPVQSLTDLVKESDSMDDIGLSALLALLMGCTGKQIINYDWPLGTRESLQAIMSSSRIPRQSENNLVPLLTQLMTSRTLFWGVVRYVISSGEKHRSVGQTGQRLIALAFVDAKLDERRSILKNFNITMEDYIKGDLDDPRRFDPMNPIRACLFSMHFHELRSPPDEDDLRSEWCLLRSKIGEAVSRYASATKNPSMEDRQLATDCLLKIQANESEDENEDYSRWLNRFRAEDSLFPDNLIDALRSFILPKEYSRFRRVRCIGDLKRDERIEPNTLAEAIVIE